MSGRTKRIEREIEKGMKSQQFEFLDDTDGIFGDKGNCYIRFWLKDGRYAGQIQILQVKFNYGTNEKKIFPKNPPNVTFVTPCYHANIYKGGAICLDILRDDKWSPMQDIDSVMSSLHLLLVEPNPSSPAHPAAGQDHRNMAPGEFQRKAMEYYLLAIRNAARDNPEKKNTLPLITCDLFKTGMSDAELEVRKTYVAAIGAALG